LRRHFDKHDDVVRETVSFWVGLNQLGALPNVIGLRTSYQMPQGVLVDGKDRLSRIASSCGIEGRSEAKHFDKHASRSTVGYLV